MSEEKVANFLKSNLIPILVVAYFARYIFPQGIYSITLTALFYYLTIYLVVGGLIIAGVFGIVGLIRSRIKNTANTSKHKSFIVTAILGLALFGISFITRNAYFHLEFNSTVWKNKSISMDFDSNLLTPRQRMMEDLIGNHLFGLAKDEIESLLGEPDYSWQSESGNWIFRYVVGPEKGIGVDDECLEISFDITNRFQTHDDIYTCN